MPIILAVCLLTGIVGINYALICKYFPDGGGVYTSAKAQGRTVAVIGALLLAADLMVTASLSAYEAFHYFGVPNGWVVPIASASIVVLGIVNSFGPKHSGSLAITLAVPTVVVVLLLIALTAPHLSIANLEPPHESPAKLWTAFVGMILALSGVEAIANLTGVMRLDKAASEANPQVGRTALKAIFPVAVEVTFGTALLGWAMLSVPKSLGPELEHRTEDMLRFLGEYYGALHLGEAGSHILGLLVGVVFGFLLLSAVNTAIAALIGLLFMLARDGELPSGFLRLNKHGVPTIPVVIATALPVVILLFTRNLDALAGLYAIGVVSAITLNLGSCTLNTALGMAIGTRIFMGATALFLAAVALTLAYTKHDALFFVVLVLMVGLTFRSFAQRRSGLRTVTIPKEVAAMVTPELIERLRPKAATVDQRIMVAARGLTPVLRFALDEAQLRTAALYVLYVKEVAVFLPGGSVGLSRAKWQEDPEAATIMNLMMKLGDERGVRVVPVFAVSSEPAYTILDLTATLGVDFLMLGASNRHGLSKLLKGNVVTDVAAGLPENIQLIIHG
jgi:amino acid transporter/nucleotide-binding universal stress UspA family protein